MSNRKAQAIPQRYLVSVERKQIGHPLFDIGSPLTFVFYEIHKKRKLRKAVAKPLVLQLGETYQFEFDETVKNHPLFFTTKSYVIMANRGESRRHSIMVSGSDKIKDRGKIQLNPSTYLQMKLVGTKSTAKPLFYQCWNHPAMGGELIIVGSFVEWDKVL